MVPAAVSGAGSVDIVIRDAPLIAQRYLLHTEISGYGRMHIHDHIQNVRTFDVVMGNSEETEGVVTLRPEWSIDGDGVER